MKTSKTSKSGKKSKTKNGAAAVEAPLQKPTKEQIVGKMERISKQFENSSTVEMVSKMLPGARIEAIAGLISGLGVETGIKIPEWAKAASKKFWDAMGINIVSGIETNLIETLGMTVEISDSIPEAELQKSGLPLGELINAVKDSTALATPEEALQFAKGRVSVAQIDVKATSPQQRTKIYFVIAICWEHVRTLRSTTELLKWLFELNSKDQTFIVPKVEYGREIRAICKEIGLKYNNPGGRPRKTN